MRRRPSAVDQKHHRSVAHRLHMPDEAGGVLGKKVEVIFGGWGMPVMDSTLLDATARKLPPLLRASAHYYNDEAEVERLLAAVRELAG